MAQTDTTRIVTFDGTQATGSTGYVAAGMLRELHRRLPDEHARDHFLSDTDVFAGTSAGAANALFFAMADDADAALDYIIQFWKQATIVAAKSGTDLFRMIGTVLGVSAVLNTEAIKGVYIDYFGSAKLGDLKRKVAITSFQLDTPNRVHRSWHPKVFHNFDENDPDMDELVVDVLMRSGSPPLLTPIYQSSNNDGPGYIDGGVWANNPSMVALTQVLSDRSLLSTGPNTDGITMLSVGNGNAPIYAAPRFRNGFGNWGYFRWLLDPFQIGLVLDVLLAADEAANNKQSETMLGDQYLRLNPLLPKPMVGFTSEAIDEVIDKVLSLENTQAQITATMDWLDRVGWYRDSAAAVARVS